MNFKNYIALALLVPMLVRAEFTAQKDGVSIVVKGSAAGEQILQANGMSLKTEQFTAQKLNPVWIEVANASDRQIELSNRSVSATQLDKQMIVKKYKYRAVLWPLLTWFIISSANGYITSLYTGRMQLVKDAIAYDMRKARGEILDPEYALGVDELKKRVQVMEREYAGVERASNIFGWANFGAAIGLWWLFSSFNKDLEIFLNQQLLQDSIMVAPGQTIKKLVVLDGTTATNRFALSIFDARTHMVKTQFEVIV